MGSSGVALGRELFYKFKKAEFFIFVLVRMMRLCS